MSATHPHGEVHTFSTAENNQTETTFKTGPNPVGRAHHAIITGKMDVLPLHEIREYVKQREEKEFFHHVKSVKSQPGHYNQDHEMRDEYTMTLMIDPKFIERLPEEKQEAEWMVLYATAEKMMAKQGVHLHYQGYSMGEAVPGEGVPLNFKVNFWATLSDEERQKAIRDHSDTLNQLGFGNATEDEMKQKVATAQALINDDRLNESIRLNGPTPMMIANHVREKSVTDMAMVKVKACEKFFAEQIEATQKQMAAHKKG